MKLAHRVCATMVLFAATSPLVAAQTTSADSHPASTADASDPVPPEHPATEAQIREYLTVTHAIENAHKVMVASIRSSRATSAPYYSASFWDDMEKAVLEIDMVGPFIPAYQKYFSEGDMAATIAFYKTAAGQRLLAVQPLIAASAGEVLGKVGRAAGEQVALKHKDEIQSLMKSSPAPLAGVAGMSGMSSGGGLIGGVSSSAPSGAVSVSSGTMAGALISRPQPVYPAAAKAARVQGAVILRALISKTGDIEDLSVVSGPPMLTASALEAVRRWKYKPYLLQGVPVDVQTTITVNFTFSDNPSSDQAPAPAATPSPQN